MMKSAVLTILALAAPTVAWAQDGADGVRTEEREIVVTAQRREQQAHEVPISVTSVGGDTLQNQGVRTLGELERAIPGFSAGAGPLAFPSLRGVSTTVSNSAENNIAVYMDGVYIANQQALTAYQPDLERVEILRGPQGTLFGRNATGGAIRLFTRGPSFAPEMSLSTEIGYYDGAGASHEAISSDTRAFFAAPLVDDVLAGSLSIAYQDTGAYLSDLITGGQGGANRRYSFRGKLLFAPTSEWEFQLTAYHQDFDEGGTYSYGVLDGLSAASAYPGAIYVREPWETAYEPGHNSGSIIQDGVVFDINYAPAWGTLTGQLSYHEMDLDFAATLTASRSSACLATFACVFVDQSNDVRQHAAELNYVSPDWGMFSFIGGVYYWHQESGAHSVVNNLAAPSTFNENTTDAFSIYGELTAELTDRLTMIGGLRFNRDELSGTTFIPTLATREAAYESLTPRLVLMYEVTDEINAYASYTRGFKSGLTGITNTASVPAFAPVDEEEVAAYEIGLKFQSRDVIFNIAAFYYDFTNKQEGALSTGATNYVTNVGPVEIYGLDADLSIYLTRDLSLSAAVAWLPQAEYTDYPNATGTSFIQAANGRFLAGYGLTPTASFDATGDRLLRAPEFNANVTLAYQSDTWDASATVGYTGEQQYSLRTIVQDAYTMVTANAGYRFANGARIGLFGRNLSNEEHISFMFATGNGFVGSYRAPRQIGVALSYDF